jgi:hypothetical protein
MNKLIIAAIIAGLSGSVFAGPTDVQSDVGNHDGTRAGVTRTNTRDVGEDRQLFVFISSAKEITGSQPEIGSAGKYKPLFSDIGNH